MLLCSVCMIPLKSIISASLYLQHVVLGSLKCCCTSEPTPMRCSMTSSLVNKCAVIGQEGAVGSAAHQYRAGHPPAGTGSNHGCAGMITTSRLGPPQQKHVKLLQLVEVCQQHDSCQPRGCSLLSGKSLTEYSRPAQPTITKQCKFLCRPFVTRLSQPAPAMLAPAELRIWRW